MATTTMIYSLQKLVEIVLESRLSSFYRTIYSGVGVKRSSKISEKDMLESLPIISLEDLQSTTFLDRLYTKDQLYTKIVYKKNQLPLLIGRTREDVISEAYTLIGDRPLIYFESPHEGTEKSMWVYGKNILPLINEDNSKITLMAAELYNIDSLWSDMSSFETFSSDFLEHTDKKMNIIISDSNFNTSLCQKYMQKHAIEIALSLPETGLIALSCKDLQDKNLIFHPVENIITEIDNSNNLIVTQLLLLPTPILRYKTDIKVMEEKANCHCTNNSMSFYLNT